MMIREGLGTKENQRHETTAQITSEICGDGDVGETPNHSAVGEADCEGDGGWGDEGVGWVETGPDYETDEAVDEKFDAVHGF